MNLIELFKARAAEFDVTVALQLGAICISLFFLYRFLRLRRAFPVAVGIVIVYAVHLISKCFEWTYISGILDPFIQFGPIAILLIFAHEIRSVLEIIGNFTMPFRFGKQTKKNADEIIHTLTTLSKTKTGALIFLERKTKLESIASSAVHLDANISSGLLINIFTGAGPLHDGGVLIRNGKIHSAACKVSMDSSLKLPPAYGARHQAAVNLSASCDAIVFTVSEEDRSISISERGELKHISLDALPEVVYRAMNVKGFNGSEHTGAIKHKIMYKGSSTSQNDVQNKK